MRGTSRAALCLFLSLLDAACGTEEGWSAEPPAAPAPAAPRSPWRGWIGARRELACEGKPEHVLCADLDGDGGDELLALTREPSALLVWSSPESAPRTLALPDHPLGLLQVSWGGRQRLLVGSRVVAELLLLDLGADDPLARAERLALPAPPRRLAVGDLAGDGLSDIVVATRANELVRLASGSAPVRLALVDPLPTVLAVLSEGVVVGSQSTQALRAYAWKEGGFVAAESSLELAGIPRAALARGSELVIAGGDAAVWRVPAPFEGARPELTAIRPGAIPIDLEWVHGPERGELLALAFRDLSYSLWNGDALVHKEYAGQDAWDAACGDLDGDGLRDYAFALRDARRVAWLLGDARELVREATRLDVEAGPHSLAVADLDGDGKAEILALCALANRLCVLRSGARGWTRSETLPAGPAADQVRAGDLDGDGRLEVCHLEREEAGSRLVCRGGAGGGALAERAVVRHALGGAASALELFDLDGDGRAEAWVADPERRRVLALVPDAAQGFTTAVELMLPESPRALALVPGPAGPALAIACGEPGPGLGLRVARLERAGELASLAPGELRATEWGLPIDVLALACAGSPPLLAVLSKARAGDGPGRIELFRLEPDGLVSAGPPLITGARPFAIASADLDGDGRPELFASAQNSHDLNLWRATASGYVPEPDLGVGLGVLDLLATDLDGDGLPEIVAANGFSNDLSLLRVER